MTDVRTFRADTMHEALELVREAMGIEAVILHTRQVARRRLLPWRKAKEEVEITAGLGVNVRRHAPRGSGGAKPRKTTAGHPSPQAGRSAAGRREAPEATHSPPRSTTSSASPATSASASSSPSSPETRSPSSPAPNDAAPDAPAPPDRSGSNGPASSVRGYSADGDVVSFSSADRPSHSGAPSAPASGAAGHSGGSDAESAFATKLDSIHDMLEKMGRSNRLAGSSDVPADLFTLYTELIDAEVDDDLARELVYRLKENATAEQLSDAAACKNLLTAMVESEIKCAGPITPVSSGRKVVALVGATGVGKTTTIAKLAANFRLRDGVKLGLVTVDTYRIAAVEQLRTYAEIIDLPMRVVTSPLEMGRALDELVGLDLVLIDTAGRSPRDELQIQELKSLLAEAQVDEVHLVMSMTSSLRSLESTAKKFAAANTTSLIMTKLDEAAGMGTLLSLSRKVGLPISYITTGQDVPDDIEPATSSRAARLVLGQEKLGD